MNSHDRIARIRSRYQAPGTIPPSPFAHGPYTDDTDTPAPTLTWMDDSPRTVHMAHPWRLLLLVMFMSLVFFPHAFPAVIAGLFAVLVLAGIVSVIARVVGSFLKDC